MFVSKGIWISDTADEFYCVLGVEIIAPSLYCYLMESRVGGFFAIQEEEQPGIHKLPILQVCDFVLCNTQ